MKYICCILAAATLLRASSAAGDDKRTSNRDQDALIALENDWLKNEYNAAELDRILAVDFLHPVITGDVLTKAQHIKFVSTHVPPRDVTKHFEDLKVRLNGDVGVVNGSVVTTKNDGVIVAKSVFTDIFVRRNNGWQAVNAQENAVQPSDH